ncbi:MAG: DUF2946 family protein [Sulfuritalea sp.]|jgi:hypothetical protein|nr:DUF2946 family protein [Sulfuritalea sp.]
MTPARRPDRLTAWIAILAILLAALAPGVARALSASPQQALPWTEICTLGGIQRAEGAAPLPGSGQHEGAMLKHCLFCLNHASHFALPPAPLDVVPAIDASAESFPFSFTAPSSRFIRAAAQPRAPPANS